MVRRFPNARGFTLVEACITVAILALAAAVVVPAVGNVGLAHLRQGASQLAGTVRATYDSAALSGQSYRMVFDFSNPSVVKVQEGAAAGSSGSPFGGLTALVMGGALNDAEVKEVPPPAELLALFGGTLGSGGDETLLGDDAGSVGAGFSPTKHDLTLPRGIKVADVWIEGMSKPAREGVVYLEFFPSGYTRNAIIHLTDKDEEKDPDEEKSERYYTVKIAALTGRTEIFGQYVEAPR